MTEKYSGTGENVMIGDNLAIDWQIPPTRAGVRGTLTRAVGPGKTRGELAVELTGQVLGMLLVAGYLWHTGALREWSPWQLAVVAVVVFDLVGGVLTNATNSAKRWYHRPAPGMRRYRLTFVACHLGYLALVAVLLLPRDWSWLLANSALLLSAAVLIEWTPLYLKRPTAIAAYLAVLLVNLTWLPLPAALAWFPILFYLKLLVCFLVPEAPIRHVHPGPRQP